MKNVLYLKGQNAIKYCKIILIIEGQNEFFNGNAEIDGRGAFCSAKTSIECKVQLVKVVVPKWQLKQPRGCEM